jgi:hypothetical protein
MLSFILSYFLGNLNAATINLDAHIPTIFAYHVFIILQTWAWIYCFHQWEFQDPKMEVLYHIRLYFVGIFPYIGLT